MTESTPLLDRQEVQLQRMSDAQSKVMGLTAAKSDLCPAILARVVHINRKSMVVLSMFRSKRIDV